MTLPDDLRAEGNSCEQATELLLFEAADRIEQLEAQLAERDSVSLEVPEFVLTPGQRKHLDRVKDGTIGYAEGHGPDDPPRPVLERTTLAQEDFDARHP